MSWIRHILARLAQIVTLGKVQATTASAGARATVAARVLGEDEAVPWIQPYGLQARPPAGASAVILAPGGSSDAAVCVLVGDRSILQALSEGDVALVDSDGQRVHLLPGDGEIHIVPDVKVIVGGTTATRAIAGIGDSVERTNLGGTPTANDGTFAGWMKAVEVALGGVALVPYVGDVIGNVTNVDSPYTHNAYIYRTPVGEGP